jgi:hypothetical protein
MTANALQVFLHPGLAFGVVVERKRATFWWDRSAELCGTAWGAGGGHFVKGTAEWEDRLDKMELQSQWRGWGDEEELNPNPYRNRGLEIDLRSCICAACVGIYTVPRSYHRTIQSSETC